MQTLTFEPRPIVLNDPRCRREPVRPAEFQPPGFADQFDYHTLVYDGFFCRQSEVVLTSPPFLNLLPLFARMNIVAAPSGKSCLYRIRNLDRHSQVRVAVPDGTTRISLQAQIGEFDIEPHNDLSDFFAGKRVIFTLSKNNRPQWIKDWISYHRDIHGANAVLLYDNQSTSYSPQQLLAALSAVCGIDRLCVVSWPFRYGPQGLDARRFWDSDFCQYGAWEHARWMFLRRARSAMNADVDELVVAEDGSSVFAAAERSALGVIRYRGHWVHGFQGSTRLASDATPIRVVDFDHYLRHFNEWRFGFWPKRHNVCAPKWTVVPRRCPDYAQWAPHRITRWLAALPLSRNFSFRHFREIGNHWKYDRSLREVFDASRYAFDQRMRENFSAVQWSA